MTECHMSKVYTECVFVNETSRYLLKYLFKSKKNKDKQELSMTT